MKKVVFVVLMFLVLSGCSGKQVFETVSDVEWMPVIAQARQLNLALPKDAAVYTVMGDEENKLYLCDGYTVAVQRMESGDLDRTVRQVTGFCAERISMIETKQEDVTRYDFAWSAVGESGDQIGRGALLDDGQYHYCVSVMGSAEKSGVLQEQWQSLLLSVNID